MARAQKRRKATVAVRRHPSGATAVQVDSDDGSQVVVCDSLRVLITKQHGAWLAHGLEIDYAIDGDTIPDVKQRFQTGLAMTIDSHLRVNNHINDLLRVAPQNIWDEYYDATNTLHRFMHRQVLIRKLQEHLPFDEIVWIEKKTDTAA